MMNITEALNWRYAVRKFTTERIEENKVNELLTATRLSASAYGLQPWRMIVVDGIDTRKRLYEYAMGQDKVVNCSHLVVLAAQTDIGDATVDRYMDTLMGVRDLPKDVLDSISTHMKEVIRNMSEQRRREWAHEQVYIALGTLLTAAAVMKIDTCPMTGFESEGVDRVLGLHERSLESSVICALGVRDPEDENAFLPKVRYGSAEMVITV
ncbi:MAG: NAD(P)H-dependent oxidoreductase [Gammaproteobacteria bacterium]|nr:NAD(P)H-dependent oxidoreductase [Gammaproteobacteria bacterium]